MAAMNSEPEPPADPVHCESCTKPVEARDVLSLVGKLLCPPCYDDEFRTLRSAERARRNPRSAVRP